MKILGTRVDNFFLEQAVKKVEDWVVNGNQKIFTIVTPNPEIIIQAQGNPELREIINKADLAVPDGAGLVWASKRKGESLNGTVYGIDLMKSLCQTAAKKGWTVGLYGARGKSSEEALGRLKKNYPGLRGWAKEAPVFSFDAENRQVLLPEKKVKEEIDWIVDKVKKTETRFLFIGLGAPKQELFIKNLKSQISNLKYNLVLMVVGGSIDEISGRERATPTWIKNLGLKWVWRLFWQPWRLKRQLRLIQFIWRVLFPPNLSET